MKPPTRPRAKPSRFHVRAAKAGIDPASPGRRQERRGKRGVVCDWKPAQKQRLLNRLKALARTTDGSSGLDYTALMVPDTPVDEVQYMVEALQNKVLTHVSSALQSQDEEERSLDKPIELWVEQASDVTGTLEEPILTAFSQMFFISSMEPGSLRHSYLPTYPHTSTLQGPDPNPGPDAGPDASQTSTPLSATTTSSPHPPQSLSTTPVSSRTSSSPLTVAPPPDSSHRGSGTAPPEPLNHVTIIISTTPADVPQVVTSGSPKVTTTPPGLQGALEEEEEGPTTSSEEPPAAGTRTPITNAKRSGGPGRSAPLTAPDSPSRLPSQQDPRRHDVDFSKIYRYLSALDTETQDQCVLTAMESAVVLDLLMCLPEELHLLDGSELHRHFMEVYDMLSAPLPPVKAERCRKPSASGGQSAYSSPASRGVAAPNARHPEDSQSGAAPAESPSNQVRGAGGGATDSEGGRGQDTTTTPSTTTTTTPRTCQSSSTQTESTNPGASEWERAGLCPLNPFRVPLRLLERHTLTHCS